MFASGYDQHFGTQNVALYSWFAPFLQASACSERQIYQLGAKQAKLITAFANRHIQMYILLCVNKSTITCNNLLLMSIQLHSPSVQLTITSFNRSFICTAKNSTCMKCIFSSFPIQQIQIRINILFVFISIN